MAVKAGYCTPMLHVAEVERSLKFYGLLGFETIDTDRCEPIGWARVHCAGGAIMFLRAEEPIDPKRYGTMLCMYTPDLPGLRDQLLAAGLKVPAIRYPQYMPSGEVPTEIRSSFPIGGRSSMRLGKNASAAKPETEVLD